MGERQEKDGNAVGEGRCDAGKGVLGARAVLHQEDARGLAVRHPGKAVGHVHADTFLPADDRPDACGNGVFDQGRGRKAEKGRYALPLEDLHNRVTCSHWHFPSLSGDAA
jgi:hypothetical protein